MTRPSRFLSITQSADAALNDSDKTFTVPAGRAWGLQAVHVTLISTATVGNRQVDILITDESDNTIYKYQAGAVQTATLTRVYVFAPGHSQDTSFTNGVMLRQIASNIVLPAGYKVRVLDSTAVDAAADDMTVRLLLEDMVE